MKTETLKKIFKILVIIILIIIIGVIVHTVRNYIIVSNLEKKIDKYESSTNFYLKSISKQTDGKDMIFNYYKKDDKEVSIIERITNGNVLKLSYYKNGNEIEQFIDDTENNKKVLRKNNTGIFAPRIENCLITENTFQKILACFCATIQETEFNGKKCYIINNFTSPSYLYSIGKNEFYLEKETGLILKKNTDFSIQTIEYEFDNIDDSIFIKPDKSEYKIEYN